LEARDIARAICAGFKDRPDECKHEKMEEVLKDEVNYELPEYGTSIGDSLLIAGLVILALNIVLLGICKWR